MPTGSEPFSRGRGACEYSTEMQSQRADPLLRPLPDAMRSGIGEDVKLGVLPKGLQVSPAFVDLSMIEAAKRRLDGHGA
jgi:hypothetical protein